MFERPHHQRIAQALEALDATLLAEHHCWFGGGTAIALRHGEFRLSNDEGRITLEPSEEHDLICGVATLTELDLVTTKLLANADRWADLAKAVEHLLSRPGRLRRCMDALQITAEAADQGLAPFHSARFAEHR